MTPTSGFVRLRGRISAHAPEKSRVWFSYDYFERW